MDNLNKRVFDFLGITAMHEKGYTGKGVKVLVNERDGNSTHARMSEDVIRQIAPDATIVRSSFVVTVTDENYKRLWESYKGYDIVNRSMSGDFEPAQYAAKKEIFDGGTMMFSAAGNSDTVLSKDILDPSVYGVDDIVYTEEGDMLMAAGTAIDDAGVHKDFVAPSNIHTALGWYGGSSCATPVVSGMAALIISAYKKHGMPWTPEIIRKELIKYADKGIKYGTPYIHVVNGEKWYRSKDDVAGFILDSRIMGNGCPRLNAFEIVPSYDEIRVKLGSKILTKNGKEILMDVEPLVKDQRIYLPIRFVAEALGCDVEWNQKNQTAIIRKEKV